MTALYIAGTIGIVLLSACSILYLFAQVKAYFRQEREIARFQMHDYPNVCPDCGGTKNLPHLDAQDCE